MIESMRERIVKNPYDYLFVGTIAFFALSIINIVFAWLGLVCMMTPFILALRSHKNLWCRSYCPRSRFFMKIMTPISLKRPIPKALRSPKTRRYIITFFCVNLMMVVLSTLNVANGSMAPMASVRFLMFIRVPFQLPQLWEITASPVVLHLSYRLYSIMFSSTIVGMLLAILYMPRSWCTICPVQTMVTDIVKKYEKNCESCR
ncbi:hypothetical protein KHM83_02425 [Fusibacter paucivorans]|uniref:4Fe-4S binding domain-containing protein n=1 Tax=Fusibacter paucivorans TaxID=76009 RepID=A0ABS5PME2_9FIRM|nr:hypothetical protein [Fusibacter paucivorans]MBS7525531.1 hypothetical protein [Fusibacter paucivorans]